MYFNVDVLIKKYELGGKVKNKVRDYMPNINQTKW